MSLSTLALIIVATVAVVALVYAWQCKHILHRQKREMIAELHTRANYRNQPTDEKGMVVVTDEMILNSRGPVTRSDPWIFEGGNGSDIVTYLFPLRQEAVGNGVAAAFALGLNSPRGMNFRRALTVGSCYFGYAIPSVVALLDSETGRLYDFMGKNEKLYRRSTFFADLNKSFANEMIYSNDGVEAANQITFDDVDNIINEMVPFLLPYVMALATAKVWPDAIWYDHHMMTSGNVDVNSPAAFRISLMTRIALNVIVHSCGLSVPVTYFHYSTVANKAIDQYNKQYAVGYPDESPTPPPPPPTPETKRGLHMVVNNKG